MSGHALLEILADGKFHSGQEIGEALGVSRSAIWKQIRKLESFGLEIYSVKGRGYRLPGGIELLDDMEISLALSDEVARELRQINLSLTSKSTNKTALEASQKEDAHGRVYLTEQQTAGRGRRGREWVSPFGCNLYSSLVWRFNEGAAGLDGLSLLVGLALAEALDEMLPQPVELKWPNDVLAGGRKLAGILLEVTGDPSANCQVVIGLGVNVAMPKLPQDQIDQPWTDLVTLAGKQVSRNAVLAAFLNKMVPMLGQFAKQGFEPFKARWLQYHAYDDQAVALTVGSKSVQGVCKGVDEHGALILETDEGIKTFHGGEVSLRSL